MPRLPGTGWKNPMGWTEYSPHVGTALDELGGGVRYAEQFAVFGGWQVRENVGDDVVGGAYQGVEEEGDVQGRAGQEGLATQFVLVQDGIECRGGGGREGIGGHGGGYFGDGASGFGGDVVGCLLLYSSALSFSSRDFPEAFTRLEPFEKDVAMGL